MAMTTRSGKSLLGPIHVSIEKERDVESKTDDRTKNKVDGEVLVNGGEIEETQISHKEVEGANSTEKPEAEVLQPLPPVRKPPSLFSQRLKMVSS